MTHALLTFGCRVNQADSLVLDRRLAEASSSVRAAPERADLVVVNTCAVTADAERAARQAIARIGRINPRARIVVTGCAATLAPGAFAGLRGVAAVWDNEAKERAMTHRARSGAAPEGSGPGSLGRTVAFLRVQTGCDQRCSYCVVPLTRGRPSSVATARVIEQVREASARGYREIVVSGIHLGAWGRDLPGAPELADLVGALDAIGDQVRFRLGSVEPMDCSDRLVDLVLRPGRFVPHLHLPIQHVADGVLARMRRACDGRSVRSLVDRIRRRSADAALGVDLIAGFPGESEADFEELADWLATAPVSYAHVFRYSPRPGTEAAGLDGRVPDDRVKRRVARLRALAASRRTAFERTQVGQRRDALALGDARTALTDNFLKVRVPAGRTPNDRFTLAITGVEPLCGLPTGAA